MASGSAWHNYFGTRGAPSPEALCRCSDPANLVLGAIANYSYPLSCMSCGDQLDPSLILDEDLWKELVNWSVVHRAIVDLHLDVGAYESWSEEQLVNIDSPVNREGLELSRLIGEARGSCYFWIHLPHGGQEAQCPCCCSKLDAIATAHGGRTLVCERCKLMAAGY